MCRIGHPTSNKKGMHCWLQEVLNSNQFTAEYMRANRMTIVEEYAALYYRY